MKLPKWKKELKESPWLSKIQAKRIVREHALFKRHKGQMSIIAIILVFVALAFAITRLL